MFTYGDSLATLDALLCVSLNCPRVLWLQAKVEHPLVQCELLFSQLVCLFNLCLNILIFHTQDIIEVDFLLSDHTVLEDMFLHISSYPLVLKVLAKVALIYSILAFVLLFGFLEAPAFGC